MVHTGWPTEIRAHACKHDSANCVRFHDTLISHYLALSATAEQLQHVSDDCSGTLGISGAHGARAHRGKSDVVHLIMECWSFLLQPLGVEQIFTLGGQQKYLLILA